MYFDRFLWNDLQHPGNLQSYTSKIDHRGFEVQWPSAVENAGAAGARPIANS